MTLVKRRKGWRMSCDVGEVTGWRMSRAQSYSHSRAHSPTLPLLHLRHSSFSNPSVALSTSQFILQPFFRFSYVTTSSLNTLGEPSMERTIMAGEHTWLFIGSLSNAIASHYYCETNRQRCVNGTAHICIY